MVKKKIFAAAAAFAIGLANICSGRQPLIANNTVSAESYSNEMQYGDYLKYKMVDENKNGTYDYIEITKCGWSATEVDIPDEIDGLPVTSIGKSAFFSSGLTSVEIPNSVTSIGNEAFYGCSSLTSITIPDSVTSIGYGVFLRSGLTSVEIPNSVTSIGDSAFLDCSGLTSINVSENNSNYSSKDGVLFNKDKTELICFPIGSEITKYIIPDSVTSIGDDAFEFCSGLTSIEIPDSVTSIGDSAFAYCSGLTSVEIPDSVTSIGDWAFYNCSDLTSITIPDIVTSIGGSAFSYTPWLEAKRAENPLVIVNSILIDGTTCSGDVKIPDSVTSIGDSAFAYCSGLTSVEIPDSVTSIGDEAFEWCENLTSITIPDSVTSIGGKAFSGTPWLEAKQAENPLVIVNSILIDGETCSGDVKIPDSVTSIGDEAFYWRKNLTSITIPDSVTTIGAWAFNECKSLTSITIENPECEIYDSCYTICNYQLYYNGVIRGYENSTAQAYAEKYGYTFEVIVEKTSSISGLVELQKYIMDSRMTFSKRLDLNDDGMINVIDAVLLRRKLIYN